MKDKDTEASVSGLLAKLSLKNNLDQDEEEEVIESVQVLEKDQDEDNDEYISKGPIRGNNHSSRANPYQMPVFAGKSGKDASMGRFIDDDTEIDFIMSRIEQPLNIPNKNTGNSAETLGETEKGIPDLPDLQSESFKPVLLMLDKDADYQVLDLGLKICLDRELKMIGIWLPETVLDDHIKVNNASLNVEIYIQLNGHKKRLINHLASIKKDATNDKFILNNQFVQLSPMIHAGALDLICDINPAELEQATRLVNAKNITDLVKCYGPTDESLLMTFCCQKNDSPALRAQIFAFLSRVLEESNDDAIEMIIKKNSAGLSALDYATMANNAKIAAFLAEMFYIFGQDLLCKDNQGNTVLHMMARKGDMVTPTLSTLMSLHFRDHNDNRRVYTSDVQNGNQQMPIHIVSMNKKCAQNIIQILAKDMPTCMKVGTDDGSLPIHLACQYSYDPTLLATLLYYDKSVINAERGDGFTPLHLVAARGEVHDVRMGLLRLDEDTQIRMIRVLLDHGANKTATVEEAYRPVDLLNSDRFRAREYLKLNKSERKANCSSSDSSNGGSPTPPCTLNALDDPRFMTPSPGASSVSSDPYMNLRDPYSPASSTMYQNEVYSPNFYNIGSVCSATTNSSDNESDSDNCSPQKLNTDAGSEVLEGSEDFDFIAKVLYNHPTIQAVMANNL